MTSQGASAIITSHPARERSNMRTLAPVDLTSIATHDAIKMGGPNAGKEI